MIVTLTANPSMDRTVEIPGVLTRDAVIRAERAVEDPGGKGVNISRALQNSGFETTAVLPGDVTDAVLERLAEDNVACKNKPTGEPIRSNITIV